MTAELRALMILQEKKIRVQLGTTGDTYVTDEYEGDDAGTKIERFNKANDTVMALKQGKIDCVIIDSLPAEEFVKTMMIWKSWKRFRHRGICHCSKKGNDELTEGDQRRTERAERRGCS